MVPLQFRSAHENVAIQRARSALTLLAPVHVLTIVGISQMTNGILQMEQLRGHLCRLASARWVAAELRIRAVLCGHRVHISEKAK